MLQLNISSLVALTHLFLQEMKARKGGTIINVASMASFLPIPYMTTYSASKVFVRHFTEALTHECKPYYLHVMLLCPNLTKLILTVLPVLMTDIGQHEKKPITQNLFKPNRLYHFDRATQ